ncbi:winged helix-turn-helix domain-containing protein [Micromonospora sp. CPCC 205371]|nr:winged helix-turn-helix domain-containing protein [Micromonospora sp. CPCC 205371]
MNAAADDGAARGRAHRDPPASPSDRSLELRVLGPIEAVVDGRFLPLGHVKQRCVLAVLAVEANRVVSRDQLVDRVWDDRPPKSATNVLYGYLGKLRTVLAGARVAAAVHRRPGGYVLAVDCDRVDLHRFRRLVADGRIAGNAGGALDEALSLWRGEAFSGGAGRWLEYMRQRVESERFEAVLDRNDVALRGGRHGRLLGELRVLAAEHALNERVVGQLMLALHHAGRSGEALAVFAATERRLREELGLDPGDELRTLERSILGNDPFPLGPPRPAPARGGAAARAAHPQRAGSTPGSGPAAGPAGRHVPRQLPASPDRFTARLPELAELDALLAAPDRRGPALVAVTGMPGVGKTALAVHWAHRVRERFPDGDLYADVRGTAAGPGTPRALLARFLRALGCRPGAIPIDLDEAAALYRTELAGRRMLLVLDDVADAEQVRSLLPGVQGCAVLVTSRRRLAGLAAYDGARCLTLDVLRDDEALTLVARSLGGDMVRAEPQAVAALVRACAGLPLALRIALANLGDHGGALRDHLPALDGGDRLGMFASPDDAYAGLRASFARSYASVPPPARRVLQLLGRHPGLDPSAQAVAAVAGIAVDQADRLLCALADEHLAEPRGDGVYAIHELLRLFAAEWAAADLDRRRPGNLGRFPPLTTPRPPRAGQAAASDAEPSRSP